MDQRRLHHSLIPLDKLGSAYPEREATSLMLIPAKLQPPKTNIAEFSDKLFVRRVPQMPVVGDVAVLDFDLNRRLHPNCVLCL